MNRSHALRLCPRPVLTTLLLALIAGCASTPEAKPRKDLLAFLEDGQSSCDEVLSHLGHPSQQYEQGRLLTYRITRDAQMRDAIASNWAETNYSLVVRCDTNGRVENHGLVALKK